MNEGSAKQLQVEKKVPRVPKTFPLNLAKICTQSSPGIWPKMLQAVMSDYWLNPDAQGLFPRALHCWRPQKSSFQGCLSLLWKRRWGQVESSSSSWDLMLRRWLRQPLCTPEDSMSCSTTSQWPFPAAHKSQILLPVTDAPREKSEGETRNSHLSQPWLPPDRQVDIYSWQGHWWLVRVSKQDDSSMRALTLLRSLPSYQELGWKRKKKDVVEHSSRCHTCGLA